MDNLLLTLLSDRLVTYANQYLDENNLYSRETSVTITNEDTGASYSCDNFINAMDALIEMFWSETPEN